MSNVHTVLTRIIDVSSSSFVATSVIPRTTVIMFCKKNTAINPATITISDHSHIRFDAD